MRLCDYFLINEDIMDKHTVRIEGVETKRRIADLIAGMTDRYAISLFTQLFVPLPSDA